MVKLAMNVVAPVCGWASAMPTPIELVFIPAAAENPDKKFRE